MPRLNKVYQVLWHDTPHYILPMSNGFRFSGAKGATPISDEKRALSILQLSPPTTHKHSPQVQNKGFHGCAWCISYRKTREDVLVFQNSLNYLPLSKSE